MRWLLLIALLLGFAPWVACSKDGAKTEEASEHAEGEEHSEGEEGHAEGEGEKHEEGVVEIQPEARANAGIRVARVDSRSLAGELETTGEVGLDEDRVAHVSSRVTGRLSSVPARLGDSVRSGQTLAVIDSTELAQAKADYLQARAQEELARSTHERESKLFAEKISSQKEVLEARAALLSAEAGRRRAEETLRILGLGTRQIQSLRGSGGGSLIPITAPLDGIVVAKEATIGEVVSPEAKLFTIGDLRRVWIWIDVFERDLGRVHIGDDVEVAVEAFPAEKFVGKVSFFGAQVDPATRTVRARIDVDNPGQRLRPGMFAKVRLSDPHNPSAAGALVPVVPESALQREGDGFVVFVQEGDHRFRVTPVQLGKRAGGVAEVLSGIKAGDMVAVEGVFFLASEAKKETLGGDHDH